MQYPLGHMDRGNFRPESPFWPLARTIIHPNACFWSRFAHLYLSHPERLQRPRKVPTPVLRARKCPEAPNFKQSLRHLSVLPSCARFASLPCPSRWTSATLRSGPPRSRTTAASGGSPQKQPVMAALPTNRPPVFHQPLLQACRRLVADRIWQHQPPPETPRVGLRQPQGCGRRRRCFDHRHSERRDRARKVRLLETGCPEELAGSLGRVTPDAWK